MNPRKTKTIIKEKNVRKSSKNQQPLLNFTSKKTIAETIIKKFLVFFF